MSAEVAIASQGAFGITPQPFSTVNDSCKGISVGGTPTWRWFPATRLGFGLTQVMAGLPPAIAGSILPRGAYKDGVFAGGMMELVPSLEDDFGWLLAGLSGVFGYGVLANQGFSSTAFDTYPAVSTATGAYVHTFVPEANTSRLGYMNIRKLLPSLNEAKTLGEEVTDGRVTGMTINMPDSGVLTTQIAFAGITPSFNDDPGWFPDYDDEFFAVVSDSTSFVAFDVNGQTVFAPCVGATITMDNGIAPPAQMRVIGSPYAYDLPAFGPRIASVRAAVMIDTTQYAGYELYTYIMANANLATATSWSSTPYKADIHLRSMSPFYFGASSAHYGFEFRTLAGNCVYSVVNNIPLVAGGGVVMTMDITPQTVNTYTTGTSTTGGSTTTIVDATGGFTAGEYIGYKVIPTTGTAQGDARIVKSNSTNSLIVDSDYPFGDTIASGVNYRLYAPPWIARLQNAVSEYDWPTTTATN